MRREFHQRAMSEFARANLFLHLFGGADIEGDAGDPVRFPGGVLDHKTAIPDPADSSARRDDPVFFVIRQMCLTGGCDGYPFLVVRVNMVEPEEGIRVQRLSRRFPNRLEGGTDVEDLAFVRRREPKDRINGFR